MVVDNHEDTVITFTTVSDLAAVVALAVDYEGKWPTTGGIRGNRITFSQIIDIGRRIRGSIDVTKVKAEDLQAGDLKSSWGLQAVHHAVPDDQAQALLKQVAIGFLLSSSKGAWDVSDDFNQIFPDYEFTSTEDFLTKVWKGKPQNLSAPNTIFALLDVLRESLSPWMAPSIHISYKQGSSIQLLFTNEDTFLDYSQRLHLLLVST